MRLRWSNGVDFQVTFDANDLDIFKEQSLSALRSFRIMNSRRVHRGETHKNVIKSGRCPYLGIQLQYGWYNPGIVRVIEDGGRLGKFSFFDSFEVVGDFVEADTLDEIHRHDEQWLLSYPIEYIWRGCYDSWRWSNAINTQIMSLDDCLRRESDSPA